MDSGIYEAFSRALLKEAAIWPVVAEFAKDVGMVAVDTFRPKAWVEGAKMMWNPAKIESLAHPRLARVGDIANKTMNRVLFPGMMAADVGYQLKQTEDPTTGRHRGLAERGAVAATHFGAGLGGMKVLMKPGRGVMAGMGIGTIAGMAVDKATGRAGRLVDETVTRLSSHPAAVAGGAPVARGV